MNSRNNDRYVKVIDGVTFIDVTALETSIDSNSKTPTKDRLRQKMINAGVEFWDQDKRIVKKPVAGISAMGGFLVSLEGDLPPGKICLRMGGVNTPPLTPQEIVGGMRQAMGAQSIHTFMNPNKKPPAELYDATVKHGHFSITHAGYLGIIVLGLSKKAELELDVQRDLVHLARETSARSLCQDDPVLVAMTEAGAAVSKTVLKNILQALESFPKPADAAGQTLLDWREERNALFPLSAAQSLGINSDVRNLMKVIADIAQDGKELEYRNVLALMNDSLHALLPEVFQKSSFEYGHQYPESWQENPLPSLITSSSRFFQLSGGGERAVAKSTVLLLGAPGIGKSTQTERIVKQLPGVMCVSTGNLVRKLDQKVRDNLLLNEVENRAAESLDRMRRGERMEPHAVYALLMAYLSPGGDGYTEYQRADTLILDGVIKSDQDIPAFEAACEAFNQQSANIKIRIDKVLNIHADPAALIARQQARVDQAAADGKQQRPDDNIDTYRRRLEQYTLAAEGVIRYYQQKCGDNFMMVDGSRSIEDTSAALIAAVRQQISQASMRVGV